MKKLLIRLIPVALFCLLMLPALSSAGDLVSAEDVFRAANNHMVTGAYDKAIEVLKTIPQPSGPETAGEFVKSRMQMAALFHALKKPEQAEVACRAVLAIFPHNTEANNFLRSLEKEKIPAYISFYRDCVRFFPSLAKGAVMTLTLVLCTMLVSPLGGLFISLGRISRFKPLSVTCWFMIWFFRGTPLLLQLFFIYYGLPSMGITLSPLAAAVIGLGLNYSAYLAEIIRSGIESIDSGQMEAAKAIGMTYSQAMRRVIIPQTYKRLMPPIGNEFIALIKDTALVSTIAMVELMRSADQLFNTYFNVNVLILAAMIYLAFTTVFTVTFEKIEKRVGAYENR